MRRYVDETLSALEKRIFGQRTRFRPTWARRAVRKRVRMTPTIALATALYRAAPGPDVLHQFRGPHHLRFRNRVGTRLLIMPPLQHYATDDHYFSDLFHELGHDVVWEHRWRLRPKVEETAVEAASVVLCRLVGFEHFWDTSTAYIQKELRKSGCPRRTWRAAAKRAALIVKYIMRT